MDDVIFAHDGLYGGMSTLAAEPIGPGGPRPAYFLGNVNFLFLYIAIKDNNNTSIIIIIISHNKLRLNVPRMPQMAV